MANQITGKILYIYPPQQVQGKNSAITKRAIVLDCTRFDPYTGERGFENTPMLEFIGERCSELDKYRQGQVVTVSFDVQGTRYRKDGTEQIFTRVQPYRIEARAMRTQAQPQPNVPRQDENVPPQDSAPQPTSSDLPF